MKKKYVKILELAIGLSFAGVLGYAFRLHSWYFFAFLVLSLLFSWKMIEDKEIAKKQEEEFLEIAFYMEQMLYLFRRTPKILTALTQMEQLSIKIRMKGILQQAIWYIKTNYTEDDLEEKALLTIEEAYPDKLIHEIHQFFLKVQAHGGEYEHGITILLQETNSWKIQNKKFLRACQKEKQNLYGALICGTVLTLVTPWLGANYLSEFSIIASTFYQGSTLLFLSLEGMVLLGGIRKYKKVLQKEKKDETKLMLSRYNKIIYYQKEREQKKSIISGGITLFLGVLSVVFKQFGLAIPLFLLGGVLFRQHKIDQYLAKSAVKKEILKCFPSWLTEVSLLLQSENVGISIKKSMEQCENILKPGLIQLWQHIQEEPESNIPYYNFLKDFHIPEVHSAMGILYSLNLGGSHSVERMEEILKEIATIKEQSQSLVHTDKLAGWYALFLFPAFLGMLKMMADMTYILIVFFSAMKG